MYEDDQRLSWRDGDAYSSGYVHAIKVDDYYYGGNWLSSRLESLEDAKRKVKSKG